MNIPEIIWTKVTVTCEKDPTKNEVFTSARITVESKPSSLSITGLTPTHPIDGTNWLLSKPKLVRLTPSSAVFEAFWWSSEFATGKFKEMPVKVECEF